MVPVPFVDALCMNNSLKILQLSDNPVSDDGATSIAKMLMSNTTIETVSIGVLANVAYRHLQHACPKWVASKHLNSVMKEMASMK